LYSVTIRTITHCYIVQIVHYTMYVVTLHNCAL